MNNYTQRYTGTEQARITALKNIRFVALATAAEFRIEASEMAESSEFDSSIQAARHSLYRARRAGIRLRMVNLDVCERWIGPKIYREMKIEDIYRPKLQAALACCYAEEADFDQECEIAADTERQDYFGDVEDINEG